MRKRVLVISGGHPDYIQSSKYRGEWYVARLREHGYLATHLHFDNLQSLFFALASGSNGVQEAVINTWMNADGEIDKIIEGLLEGYGVAYTSQIPNVFLDEYIAIDSLVASARLRRVVNR
jgi:hypothetical protein